ncbi:hypothetical protein [Nitrosopumilus sp.]|uniref:hypothetical protein n=1 Tax=Nitrosopumilus sp. TaxID=2024843 RepID=UPI00247DB55E|nr:hypothetical protein [Nitrosopumilus sp.]MCV0431566.1 hypothetical protein [Nitrosopumilus sp.]
MNCKRCHHTDEAHSKNEHSDSLIKAGECQIPTCTCRQYVDPIQEIDEELL